jgi:hypothetical protein
MGGSARLAKLDLERRETDLREQLALTERLGASFVITHLSLEPMTLRLATREALRDTLSCGLGFARRPGLRPGSSHREHLSRGGFLPLGPSAPQEQGCHFHLGCGAYLELVLPRK